MKHYQFLIFDLDNTIFDFWGAEKYALTRIFEEDGVEMTDENLELYRSMNHELWEQYEKGEITQTYLNEERFSRFFHHFGKEVSGVVSNQKFSQYLAIANTMMPDAIEVLDALKENYTLLAATNGIEDTQWLRLKAAGLEHYFDTVYISDVIGFRKPSLEFFQAVVAQTDGLTTENALMIGDSFKADIYGASRVGLDTCWYMENPVKPEDESEEILATTPTYVIHHLTELLPIVEN